MSSDKDLMQLIRPGVEMLDPIKQKPIGPAEVMEKFGVPPEKMIDVQALIGDSTDNVPGVPGIGPKTRRRADQRIWRPGGGAGRGPGDEAGQAPRHPDRAARTRRGISRELVTLRDDVPLPLPVDQLVACPPDRPKLAAWLRRRASAAS